MFGQGWTIGLPELQAVVDVNPCRVASVMVSDGGVLCVRVLNSVSTQLTCDAHDIFSNVPDQNHPQNNRNSLSCMWRQTLSAFARRQGVGHC